MTTATPNIFVSSVSPKAGVRNNTPNIQQAFRATGARAGIRKCLSEFNTAIANATMHINITYGNVIKSRLNTNSHLLLREKTVGIIENEISASTTRLPRIMKSNVPVTFTSSHASFLPLVSRYSVNTGIKAALNAPSPKSRRKRFGILKATTKASQARLVPKKLAHIMSLASPKTLLNSVQRLTVLADFKKLFFSCI